MSFHSLYSPSGAKRWMTCSASVPLSENAPNRSSSYADEGTAAHELIERCLLQGKWPEDFRGQTINDFLVDDEMIEATKVFLVYVRQLIADNPGAYWQPEQRFESPRLPDHGGTIDFLLQNEQLHHIVDYKHGAGVPVDAYANEQLSCYAAMSNRGQQTIRMTIVQPRVDHDEGPIRTFECNQQYLYLFEEQVGQAIQRGEQARAIAAASDIRQRPELFTITEEGCRWCPASHDCPAHYELAKQNAMIAFSDPGEAAFGNTLPVRNLDDEQVLWLLRNADTLRKFLDEVYEFALEQAHAGNPPEGFKIVQSQGRRRWVPSDEELLAMMTERGFKVEDCVKQTVKSFNQLQKLPGIDKEWLDSLTERPVSGVKLVPDTDPRLSYQDPGADYSHIPSQETT